MEKLTILGKSDATISMISNVLVSNNFFPLIVVVNNLTEGAVCTSLLAKEFIDIEDDLLIANSDQFIEYEQQNFNYFRELTTVNSIVFCFT